MVARINIVKDIKRVLDYHEKKLVSGEAICLLENGFHKDPDELSYQDKKRTFQKRMALNENVRSNTLHLSLNFHPSDLLKDRTMISIAHAYIEKIGFGEQPYLAYRHFDSGHPHLHIVSTQIQRDGSCINTHQIGLKKSEPARKQIEKDFQLVKADGYRKNAALPLSSHTLAEARYGEQSTMLTLSRVLAGVISSYLYASLSELNSILKLYAVRADRTVGLNPSHRPGLLYQILNDQGKPVGMPIKASLLPGSPTLKNLEPLMRENGIKKQVHAQRIRDRIDRALLFRPHGGMDNFRKDLSRDNIELVWDLDKSGTALEISFVDQQAKVVFTGPGLGPSYTVQNILERARGADFKKTLLSQSQQRQSFIQKPVSWEPRSDLSVLVGAPGLRQQLMESRHSKNTLPSPLLEKRKRKQSTPSL